MAAPILNIVPPKSEFFERIGRVASEFAWIEMMMAEMLAFFCQADPGAMYVITQNVSNSTLSDWLRTLINLKIQDPRTVEVLKELLNEIETARAERNTVVHGTWVKGNDDSLAEVHTFKWERAEAAKAEVYDLGDLDDLIAQIEKIQTMIGNLGLRLGFLKGK